MRRSSGPRQGNAPEAVDKIVFDQHTIGKRVIELGRAIDCDYQEKELVVVTVLNGAWVFACDLVRALALPVKQEFVAMSRFGNTAASSRVRISKDLEDDVFRKHVLIVEDIVDTGLTLNYLLGEFEKRSPASLRVCSLLDRPELRLVDRPLAYVGFRVNEEFLIGYGLDYRNHYRDLPFIATMKLERISGQG